MTEPHPDVASIRAALQSMPDVERRALVADLWLAEQARVTARELTRALRGGDEYVDQHGSPAGARRFIGAIRSGKLKGVRAGRRWLATRDDHDRWLVNFVGPTEKPKRRSMLELTVAQELERELRLVGVCKP